MLALSVSSDLPKLDSTTTLSSKDLSVSLGAANIALKEQLALTASVLPTHLFGSSIAKYVPVVTLMLLILVASPMAVIVTDLDATPSASTLPNSTGEGASDGGEPFVIRWSEIVPPLEVLTLPVPDCLSEGQPSVSDRVLSVPGLSSVRTPLASRVSMTSWLLVVYLHFTLNPKISPSSSQDQPRILRSIEVMFGRVPEKLEYSMCQGSVSVFSLILPDSHVPIVVLVTKPSSKLAVLAKVFVWSEPSSVIGHLMVEPKLGTKLSGEYITLKPCSVNERLFADAVPTSAASSSADASAASMSLLRVRMSSPMVVSRRSSRRMDDVGDPLTGCAHRTASDRPTRAA